MADLDRIRESLRDDQDEARVQRMWRGIEARRRPAAASIRWPRWVIGGGIAATAAVLALVLLRSAPAPLALASGQPLPSHFEATRAPARAVLSDGSALRTEPGTRVDVLESSPETVALALRRGRARFDVRPGGPRLWRIECGAVVVQVVGTAFTIDRHADAVAVTVHRGAVLVRGDDVPDRVQRLEAGDAIHVGAPETAAHAAFDPASETGTSASPQGTPQEGLDARELAEGERPRQDVAPGDSAHVLDAPSPEAPLSTPPAAGAVAWERAAARGAYDDAFDALGEGGVARATERTSTIDELLTLADVARLSGHPRDAVAPLERLIAAHPEDGRAALAAYTLAQLRLTQLDQPAHAAMDFARSLDLGLPAGLREAAYAKRAEALGRAEDPAAAGAAATYLARYPDGRYRDSVTRWSGR